MRKSIKAALSASTAMPSRRQRGFAVFDAILAITISFGIMTAGVVVAKDASSKSVRKDLSESFGVVRGVFAAEDANGQALPAGNLLKAGYFASLPGFYNTGDGQIEHPWSKQGTTLSNVGANVVRFSLDGVSDERCKTIVYATLDYIDHTRFKTLPTVNDRVLTGSDPDGIDDLLDACNLGGSANSVGLLMGQHADGLVQVAGYQQVGRPATLPSRPTNPTTPYTPTPRPGGEVAGSSEIPAEEEVPEEVLPETEIAAGGETAEPTPAPEMEPLPEPTPAPAPAPTTEPETSVDEDKKPKNNNGHGNGAEEGEEGYGSGEKYDPSNPGNKPAPEAPVVPAPIDAGASGTIPGAGAPDHVFGDQFLPDESQWGDVIVSKLIPTDGSSFLQSGMQVVVSGDGSPTIRLADGTMASTGVLGSQGTVIRMDTPACGATATVYVQLANGQVGEFTVDRSAAAKNNGASQGNGKKVGHGC